MRSTRASTRRVPHEDNTALARKSIRFSFSVARFFSFATCRNRTVQAPITAGTLVLATRDAEQCSGHFNNPVTRQPRDRIEKKVSGEASEGEGKKCARARRTSIALHSGALGEREVPIYTTAYVHIFSLLVLDDRRAMVVAPFLYAMSEEREHTTLARCTYAHP